MASDDSYFKFRSTRDRFASSYFKAVAAYLIKELTPTANYYLVDLEGIRTSLDGKV